MLKHDGKKEGHYKYKWGAKRNLNKYTNTQFYESFTNQEGVQYCLDDFVYIHRTGDTETSIGKLVKLYNTPNQEKKLKIVRLFRPIQIRHFLGNIQPIWNELFLDSGEGTRLSDIYLLDDVIKKCSVVCTSQDKRNPQPSKEELRAADYIFYRTFDANKHTISDIFEDQIGGIQVENYFNRKEDRSVSKLVGDKFQNIQKPSVVSKPELLQAYTSARGSQGCSLTEDTDRPRTCSIKEMVTNKKSQFDMNKDLVRLNEPNVKPIKKRKPPTESEHVNIKKQATNRSCIDHSGFLREKAHKLENGTFEVTRKPSSEKKSWLKEQPWDEKLMRAEKKEKLVLLENLDPSYTSSDVEDIIWSALNEKVEARMIRQSHIFGPYYGKAFAIFESKDKAKSAIVKLAKRCLMLPDGRPLIATRGYVNKPGENATFFGHISIDRLRARRGLQREAVSTSHCAQPNTIEYDMALEWRMLQEQADCWWKAEHQVQAKEVSDIKKELNSCMKNEHLL